MLRKTCPLPLPYHVPAVLTDYSLGLALLSNDTTIQPEHLITQLFYRGKVVADEDDRLAMLSKFSNFIKAFQLKGSVSDRQDFVDQENVKVRMHSHSKA
jgi:hypothetical protein